MTTTAIVAYDYYAQRWIDGPSAVSLRKRQLEAEIAYLSGPEGEPYARFMGIHKANALALLRGSLAKLEGKAA